MRYMDARKVCKICIKGSPLDLIIMYSILEYINFYIYIHIQV